MRFLQAVGWLAVLVFVVPALGCLALLLLSRLQATTMFVVWYAVFLLVWFLAAVPVVALTWMLPAVVRAVLGAAVIYLVALVAPFASTMARYPLYLIGCGHPPVVATTFAASYTYRLPGSPSYAVTPLDDRLFCTPEEAAAAGFHEA